MNPIKNTWNKVVEKTSTVRTELAVAGGIAVAIIVAAAFLKQANENYEKAKALETAHQTPDAQ